MFSITYTVYYCSIENLKRKITELENKYIKLEIKHEASKHFYYR